MSINYRQELNEQQYRAVEYIDGASLVIAGAGSGKTRVLTYKIAYLIEHGYKPWTILALTFTNKAAREMKERIASLISPEAANSLWMGTFHSIFNRILRREVNYIGLKPNYTIYQPSDSQNLIKTLVKEMGLDDKVYKPSVIHNKISSAKNALIIPEEYCMDRSITQRDADAQMPMLGKIYSDYVIRMRMANSVDFDDLLLYTYQLFNHNETLRRQYASKFRFILVDEYQDTNFAQHQILGQLTQENNHVCVVGDDAQSIYSFRGAKIDNILEFGNRYINTQLFKLEQNYRSTRTIIKAANSIIAHNKHQIQKEVFSNGDEGSPIVVDKAYTDIEEGEIVYRHIENLHQVLHVPYHEIAILYRTNSQSRIFEEALRKRAIPYHIYGGHSFYETKIIRDVLAYFRLVVNPYDEEALKRIINYPARGIGNVTVSKLLATAVQYGVPAWQVLADLELYPVPVTAGARKKLGEFAQMIRDFIRAFQTEDAYVLGNHIVKKSGLWNEVLSSTELDSHEMKDHVNELLNGLHTFVARQKESETDDHLSLLDYLNEVSLLSDTDSDDGDVANNEKVTLMTIHSAKGLEFDSVFIVGLEEDLFPSSMIYTEYEREEERRLFYVAVTRAKRHLFLSHADSRFRFGLTEMSEPSRFLKEIDQDCISYSCKNGFISHPGRSSNHIVTENRPLLSVAAPKLRKIEKTSSPSYVGVPKVSLKINGMFLRIGQHIMHSRFGEGKILFLEGEDEDSRAEVLFNNGKRLKLLLRFASITPLD